MYAQEHFIAEPLCGYNLCDALLQANPRIDGYT